MNSPPDESTLATSPSFIFSSPEGFALCRSIITARLGYDPHDYQLEGICKSLDGVDLLAITQTGSGKTGFLVMYLLVMHTLMQTPSPRKLPSHFRKDPAMIVVCPTKSLEQDMVSTIVSQGAGLSTRVINADSTDKARRRNLDIWAGVAEAVHVLLLAPEQLRTKDFEKLVNRNDYQQRVVAIGIDEAHLLDTWGKTFRTAYKSIGPSRMRFANNPVLIVLTA
ncbi:P-loop containing nucleoside triphosphate hydrolase protein, partial [Cerioporus squamosus]